MLFAVTALFRKLSENEEESEGKSKDGETDEEDHAFFDTRDFLSSSSFKSSTSDFLKSENEDSDEEDQLLISSVKRGFDVSTTYTKSNYSKIRRRKKLPNPVEKEKGVSLWSFIKDNIGKDLIKVCPPVYFNEPLSSLQKCFEDLEYSYLLNQAYEYVSCLLGYSYLMRMLYIAAFTVSGYASTEGRDCKPYKPPWPPPLLSLDHEGKVVLEEEGIVTTPMHLPSFCQDSGLLHPRSSSKIETSIRARHVCTCTTDIHGIFVYWCSAIQ